MNLQDIEVRVNKPYPEIVGTGENPQTVAILKNLVNGRVGENGAVMTYVFQSVVADKVNEEIAEIFEEIGVVEMMHMDMLMHAMTDFGGVPKYEDSNGNFFTTANLNYSLRLMDMLDNNIRAETLAIDNYQMAIERVENQSLKDLFARIIEDEKRHIEIFRHLKNNVEFMSI